MSVLVSTPHRVKRIRPSLPKNADTNVTEPSYDVPPATEVTVRGLFQIRQGTLGISSTQVVDYDAVFYTRMKDVFQELDLIVVTNQGGVTGKFKVQHAAPKTRLGGMFSHTEVYCSKDGTRA